jgi:small subunit ribosomal protein S4e
MSKSHLKRLAVPKSWNINKKTTKWVAKPDAGRKNSISLNVIFLEQLKLVTNMRELKNVLKTGTIFVDSKKIASPRFGVGFMDILKIEKESYRMVFDSKGRITAKSVKDDKLKLVKIIGKTRLAKKTQLNLADGRNVLVDKDEYKTGDSIVIDLESKKIKEHFKLGSGMLAYITSGNHISQMGTVEKIEKNDAYIKSKEGIFKTLKDYVFIIGKEKPAVEL